jgi:hypothetical protein
MDGKHVGLYLKMVFYLIITHKMIQIADVNDLLKYQCLILLVRNNDNENLMFNCSFFLIVNRTDSTRMDLIVANDQHLYLKACDYRERQKWLVAIATQKASYPNSTNEQQYVYQSSNLLKCKQSELRLYCDLLMQQIHEMKNLVNTEQMPVNEAKVSCCIIFKADKIKRI